MFISHIMHERLCNETWVLCVCDVNQLVTAKYQINTYSVDLLYF